MRRRPLRARTWPRRRRRRRAAGSAPGAGGRGHVRDAGRERRTSGGATASAARAAASPAWGPRWSLRRRRASVPARAREAGARRACRGRARARRPPSAPSVTRRDSAPRPASTGSARRVERRPCRARRRACGRSRRPGSPAPGGHRRRRWQGRTGSAPLGEPVRTPIDGTSARVAARSTSSSAGVAASPPRRRRPRPRPGRRACARATRSPPARSSAASCSARTPGDEDRAPRRSVRRLCRASETTSRGPIPSAFTAGAPPARARGSPGGCRSRRGSRPSTSRRP